MTERHIDPSDLLQLPTAITLGSFALVLHGSSKLDTPKGKAEVMVGRAGDVIDGIVARKLNMSSDAGAIADAACDKAGMLAIGVAAWQHDIVPKPVLATMAAKHSINTAATFYNGLRDEQRRSIRPPKSGKLGMAADNIAIGSFMLASELKKGGRGERIATALGYTAAAAGLIFGAVAARHYLRSEFNFEEAS